MLKYAYDYKEEVSRLLREASLDDKNKYYFLGTYSYYEIDVEKRNWD